MRTAIAFRLLLVPAALFAAACEDSSSPSEPSALEHEVPVPQDGASGLLAGGRWADGYLHAAQPTAASYAPNASSSFNASGGAMTLTKVAGTTGRYVARFRGLSALLGSKSTVHVSGFGTDASYCKPAAPRLVRDSIEVRCFKIGTGAAVNAQFKLMVSRDYPGRAFAYAHQPTATSYTPAAAGTSNPYGGATVTRSGLGQYQVYFAGLVGQLSENVAGHVQVNAVGTGKAHCKPNGWGGEDVIVMVNCYTPAGLPVDSKFTVFFTLPAASLAYAWSNQPSTGLYNPLAAWSSNPAGAVTRITRVSQGTYTILWEGLDPFIVQDGNVQVTAYGTDNAQCKVTGYGTTDAVVRCLGANGAPVDTRFLVLFHS